MLVEGTSALNYLLPAVWIAVCLRNWIAIAFLASTKFIILAFFSEVEHIFIELFVELFVDFVSKLFEVKVIAFNLWAKLFKLFTLLFTYF